MKNKFGALFILLVNMMTTTVNASYLSIGHRGCRDLRPENTIASFRHAIEQGMEGIEFDVHLTQDGQLVIHHDFTINSSLTRNQDGSWVQETLSIPQTNYEDLKNFILGSLKPNSPYKKEHPLVENTPDERIPLLEDLFMLAKEFPKLQLFIEIKTDPENREISSDPQKIAEAVVHKIKDYNLEDRCHILAFEVKVLQEVKKRNPNLKLNLNYTPYTLNHSPWFSGLKLKDHQNSIPLLTKASGATGWSVNYKALTPENIKQAHNIGLKVYAWTVNNPQDMQNLISWGIDGIITDRPDVLMGLKK
ncbi:MAG: hypothetical protein KBB83_06235 [Alphaproteobacteria bacterium]|nr:hypothetical protein [Alphaproteobacteria bacterium]